MSTTGHPAAGSPAGAASGANIPFIDLAPLHGRLRAELRAAVDRVLESGLFILGAEVEAFENEFSAWLGAGHAVGVASGTDAIELALRAAGVGPGDEVITVAHTAVATVTAVERAGATPVLVDVEPGTWTMDPAAAEAAVTPRTAALLPVHIYGQAADLTRLTSLAEGRGLLLVEDCAQAHGALHRGRTTGTWGALAAFSFYPTKNLGAYGDGGMIVTADEALASRLRMLRNHGWEERYVSVTSGVNSRLDELQAAILRVKLRYLDEVNSERRDLAARYDDLLRGVEIPSERRGDRHVYHIYAVRHDRRDEIREALAREGIGAQVHYPVPVHLQPAYGHLGLTPGSLPLSESLARSVLSLPLYPGLGNDNVRRVAEAVAEVAS